MMRRSLVGFQLLRRPLHQVVADAHHQVDLAHEPGRVVLGAQARREEGVGAVGVHDALAHEGRDHVQPGLLAEPPQRGRRALAGDAVSGQDHRPLGALQQGGRAMQLARHRLDQRPGAAWHRPAGDLALHHVVGQLEVGRPRLLPLGHRERLAHRLGDDRRVVDARVPLRHRLHHPDDVDVLVALLVHLGEAGLAGQRHHRRPVEVCVGEPGHEVRRPGPERPQAHAGLARQAAVRVGHERGALLVAHGDEGDLARRVERVVQVERLLAGDAEHVPDALVLEAVHEQVRGPWHRAGQSIDGARAGAQARGRRITWRRMRRRSRRGRRRPAPRRRTWRLATRCIRRRSPMAGWGACCSRAARPPGG